MIEYQFNTDRLKSKKISSFILLIAKKVSFLYPPHNTRNMKILY
jgi:hypothetical protein